jgi:hypothetical protein
MNPSEKLIDCLRLNYKHKLPVINTINKCIEEGAEFDKPFSIYLYIPLYYAIYHMCDINVIKLLKEYWWDPEYYYENVFEFDNTVFVKKYYISDFLNLLYGSNNEQNNFIKECASLFGIEILEDDTARQKLMYSNIRKYDSKIDNHLNEHHLG